MDHRKFGQSFGIKAAFSGCIWLLLCLPAFSGAWVQQPGEVQIISTIAYHSGSNGYDDFGNATETIDFYKLESAIYGEVGILKNWSIVSRFAYQDVYLRRESSLDSKAGLGASQIAIKRKIADFQDWVFTAQAGVSIPGSTENGLDLRLGEGDLEWEIRGLAGGSFSLGSLPGFIDMQIAKQFRANQTPNEWKVDITVGIYPVKNIMVMGQVFALRGDEAKFSGVRTLGSTKFQGSMVWMYKQKSGLQIYISRPVSGRNVIADRAIGIGWWRRF